MAAIQLMKILKVITPHGQKILPLPLRIRRIRLKVVTRTLAMMRMLEMGVETT